MRLAHVISQNTNSFPSYRIAIIIFIQYPHKMQMLSLQKCVQLAKSSLKNVWKIISVKNLFYFVILKSI